MTRADSVHSTPPLNTSATTPIGGLDWLDIKADASAHEIFRAIGRLREEARNEIDQLIRFLDSTENHMELEDDGDLEQVGDDEPSLGSFDRMPDQDKSWRQVSIWAFPEIDGEVDDCDREDCDPDEHKQQPPEMGGAA
jgi:hypothetical protein